MKSRRNSVDLGILQDISDDFMYPENREKYYFDVLDILDRGNDLVKYTGPEH